MKKISILVILLSVNNLFGQQVIKIEKETAQSFYVYGSNFKGELFTSDYNSQWISLKKAKGKFYTADTIENTDLKEFIRFTPTKNDIEKAEEILQSQIKSAVKRLPAFRFIKGPNIYRKLKHYKRQYFGFLVQGKLKLIFINAFWDDLSEWPQAYYQMYDGGNYYWNVKVDLTAQKLFDFGVNGSL